MRHVLTCSNVAHTELSKQIRPPSEYALLNKDLLLALADSKSELLKLIVPFNSKCLNPNIFIEFSYFVASNIIVNGDLSTLAKASIANELGHLLRSPFLDRWDDIFLKSQEVVSTRFNLLYAS